MYTRKLKCEQVHSGELKTPVAVSGDNCHEFEWFMLLCFQSKKKRLEDKIEQTFHYPLQNHKEKNALLTPPLVLIRACFVYVGT